MRGVLVRRVLGDDEARDVERNAFLRRHGLHLRAGLLPLHGARLPHDADADFLVLQRLRHRLVGRQDLRPRLAAGHQPLLARLVVGHRAARRQAAAIIVNWYWMSMMPSLLPCFGSIASAKLVGGVVMSLGL